MRVLVTLSLFAYATWGVAQMDTISLVQAIANVDNSRASKQGDQLASDLTILATRQIIDGKSPEDAINTYREAIDVLSVYKDSAQLYEVYLDLAMLHTSIGQHLEALNLLDEAIDYYMSKPDSTAQGVWQNFAADSYIGARQINQALPLVEQASNRSSVSQVLLRLNSNTTTALIRNGVIVDSLGPTDTTAIERSPTRTRLDEDYSGLTDLNSGYYQYKQQNYALAVHYLKRSLQSTHDGVILRDALNYLAQVHQDTEDYELAFSYMTRYAAVNDSLLSAKRQQIINRLRIQMQSYEQQAKISELEKEKNVAVIFNRMQKVSSVSLLIASIIILIGAYLAIRNYQKRLSVNEIISNQNEEINHRRIVELENNLKIETMHSMITGQEAERERVSKELHDSLGGLLSTVKLHFDALQSHAQEVTNLTEYKKAYSLLDIACNEVRSIANNMQPDALLSMGLVPAISDLVNRAQSQETPVIEFQYFDVQGTLEPTASLNIYRIVQELLSNSLKHAEASEILVQLIQKDDELMITVEDDGKGYEPGSVKKGMGTGNIESRVNFLKGELSIQSAPGDGTSTLITVPIGE